MKICKKCHAVCPEKRWYYDVDLYEAYHDAKGVQITECEGCQRLRKKDFHGTVYIEGDVLSKDRGGLLRLITNEGKIGTATHPLSRILDIIEEKNRMVVHTLNERLALHIGLQLKKTYRGKIHLEREGDWSRGERHDSLRDDITVHWIQSEDKQAGRKKSTASSSGNTPKGRTVKNKT